MTGEPAPNADAADERGQQPTATLTPKEKERLSIRYGSRYVEIIYLGEHEPWDGGDVYLEHVRALRGRQGSRAGAGDPGFPSLHARRPGQGGGRGRGADEPPHEATWVEWVSDGLLAAFYVFMIVLALGSIGN